MSSVYTGVGGNVTQSTSPTETIPADGDNRNVASVNTALQKILDYIALIWAGAFTGQTSSTPGLQGTGGASAQGGKFTAGGGASPVKGMVNLVPTTNAPSSADNGDCWITSGGVLGTKLNGNVRTVGVLEAAQTWTATQTGASFPKAYGVVSFTGSPATSGTATNTLNVTSVTASNAACTVNLSITLGSSSYAVLLQGGQSANNGYTVVNLATTSFGINKAPLAGGAPVNFTNADLISFALFSTS